MMCDNCGSWRRLSSDTFVPSPWICSNNIKDPERLVNVGTELSDKVCVPEQEPLSRLVACNAIIMYRERSRDTF